MEGLHLAYEDWIKQEENLSGVLNNKITNAKNLELKDKINYWRDTIEFRQRGKERLEEKQNHILEILDKYIENFNIDKDKVETCKSDFQELIQERYKAEHNEDILNNFLLKLKEFKLIEIQDIRK